jgi:hypothetical protein
MKTKSSSRMSAIVLTREVRTLAGVTMRVPPLRSRRVGKGALAPCLLSSVQFSSVQFSSVQFSSVQFSSVQFSSVQFSSGRIDPKTGAARVGSAVQSDTDAVFGIASQNAWQGGKGTVALLFQVRQGLPKMSRALFFRRRTLRISTSVCGNA